MNWIAVALPLGAVMLTVILLVTLAGSGAGGLTYLIFIPIMLATYLATGLTYWLGRRAYPRQLAKAQADYADQLRQTETRLQSLRVRQQGVLCEAHPDLSGCLQRAQKVDPRLGERRPVDSDFLAPRMGVGAVPASFTINAPQQNARPPEFERELALADDLISDFASVPDAPVFARLAHTGSIGLAGKRSEVVGLARAILGHLLTHHWPSEVQIAAIGQTGVVGDWRWTHDLPHATGLLAGWQAEVSANGSEPPGRLLAMLEAELQRREQTVETTQQFAQGNESPTPPLPRLVIVFDSLPPDFSHPALTLLLEKGLAMGIYGLFLTDKPRSVPGGCGAVIEIQSGHAAYRETGSDGLKADFRPDLLELKQAEALAHALAAIRWPRNDDLSQPPDMITFLKMFEVAGVDDLPVEQWWDEGAPYGYLRAPIGKTSSTAHLVFDLNDTDGAHGPHGLIGGMTGSGKSEALKSIILSLAVTHHPFDLNFALIDYKGGAAFNELERLPHTVGVVTDIETHATYAERVLLALTGEIENRKRILEHARGVFGFGRSHIDEYRRLPVKRPLPRLLIVFDEFAEFKQRHPDESKRLVSIARLGRSLGVHLILATQNIEAAIDPQILQNSTFRICLRVSEPQDSVQMVGIPDAVNLIRGRAYFRAQTRRLYQSAFAGGEYRACGDAPRGVNQMKRIWPDGREETIFLPEWNAADAMVPAATLATEASAVVDRLVAAKQRLKLKEPSPVWPDPLPERIYLPDLLNRQLVDRWSGSAWRPADEGSDADKRTAPLHPILGLFDHPARQQQYIFQIDPDQGGGHLLVFGSAGTGKSTLLQSLVVSLARMRTPSETNIYILDFGGASSLKILEALPHVGAVVTRFETERVERLIQFVHSEVARRGELFRDAHVFSLADYNGRVDPPRRLPALFLIIDGFGDFKRAFPLEIVNSVAGLVSGGLASGIYLVVSASLQADVPNDLFANINLRLTFSQADQTEYFRIVGQPSEAKLHEDVSRPPPPGRGLLRGTPPFEFQAALPTEGKSDQEQVERLFDLAIAMKQVWLTPTARPILSLPLLVTLPEPETPGASPDDSARPPLALMLGTDYATLEPIGLALDLDGPTFLVAGATPRSGKTALLKTWIIGLAEKFPPRDLQFLIIDFHSRSLQEFHNLPHIWRYVGRVGELQAAAGELAAEIARRAEALERAFDENPAKFDGRAVVHSYPHLVVVIDDYDAFAARVDNNERSKLGTCVALSEEAGVSFILAGNAAELPRDFEDPLIQRIRRHGCGVLLGGSTGIDQFNNARLLSFQTIAGLPAGRGYHVCRGQARLFQAAVYWRGNENQGQALERRIAAISNVAR